MKKNLFCMWLLLLAILFSVNTQAQMTIGGKKEPEAFSVLELLNKGGLRLPQMTTAQRNAFAVKNTDKGNGLTIYNSDTKCVEYWNASRWISMCDGTSQATISPQPCVNVAADGTGCDQQFEINDPDCPNGPFNISIMAGGDYATLDPDNTSGTFKIKFNVNESVNIRNVLVRVTSSCTNSYKEFIFSQNGVDCSTMPYSVPSISPSGSSLTYCAGGAVYLSVPANTPNLDKLIWTRNGYPIDDSRGANYIVVNQRGIYNVSMGAAGCNTNAANERNISDDGSTTQIAPKVSASNDGVICGTNNVTLTASGNGSASVVWFHNGKEERTGQSIQISGDSSVGEWFAAVKDGTCYSKPSKSILVSKSEAAEQVSLDPGDVLVNDVPLSGFTKFCAGGSLNLSVKNQKNGITYTWYNGDDVITTNPFIVPASQTTISLRMIARDNSGAKCSAEQKVLNAAVIQGSTPEIRTIDGNTALCDGEAKLTINPTTTGTYTYQWYKNNELIVGQDKDYIFVYQGGDYSATITNTTGCVSPAIKKTISNGNSNRPELSWEKTPPNDTAAFGSKFTFITSTSVAAESYVWTKNGVELKTLTSANGTIEFVEADGEKVTITVTAKNYCGTSDTLEKIITTNSGCPTPEIVPQAQLDQSVTGGSDATVSITLKSGTANQPTYQWYVNKTSASTAGATLISGATTSSYTERKIGQGDYYYYCIVQNGCTGKPTATPVFFHVKASTDPGTIAAGTGTLTGKTCFDIAETASAACGTLESRSSMRADFNNMSAQEYKFTTSITASVSNVRFVVVESESGKIVESYSSDAVTNPAATIAKGTVVTLKITYKKTLSSTTLLAGNGTAVGRDNKSALTLAIYAIYNDGPTNNGTDKKVQLTAQIKDCMCCGAKISPTEWRAFMCHNLGADETLDPFKDYENPKILGNYYQWGIKEPIAIVAGTRMQYNPDRPAGTWSGTAKTANDPCPDGYRVPTMQEWKDVIANNSGAIKYVGAVGYNKGGLLIGPALMLPAAGSYTPSTLFTANSTPGGGGNLYYSSTDIATINQYYFYTMGSLNPFPNTTQKAVQDYAMSVRCISEK